MHCLNDGMVYGKFKKYIFITKCMVICGGYNTNFLASVIFGNKRFIIGFVFSANIRYSGKTVVSLIILTYILHF